MARHGLKEEHLRELFKVWIADYPAKLRVPFVGCSYETRSFMREMMDEELVKEVSRGNE